MSIPGLDAYITGGRYHTWTDEVECRFGHKWAIEGFSEYGMSWPADEDNWMVCPECGHYATEFLKQELEYRKELKRIKSLIVQATNMEVK